MSSDRVTKAVSGLYDTYPFPPEPLLDEAPPGYNWRWNWRSAYNFCLGRMPEDRPMRILDAGCGTGVSTEYLVHLNPQAHVTAIDISSGTLAVAKERCQRSGADRVEFHHLSLFDADKLEGEFDLINSVGVLHHTADPIGGIQALAKKLAPGGLMHIFVYGELGRWEIELMQKAIGMLQGDKRGDYRDGVKIGREIFGSLPENNRILRREKERWSMENHKDECFADMYVHPQEIDYNIDTLFELIDASGLDFIGFSNPKLWELERILDRAPEALARAKALPLRQQYRLLELLDPDVAHYEFFLAKPPFAKADWSQDKDVMAALPHLQPCIDLWEGASLFNYDYQPVKLNDAELAFMEAVKLADKRSIGEIMTATNLDIFGVRSLIDRQLIILS